MWKKIIILVVGLWILGSQGVFAQNNKFGMHVAVPEENELRQVAELVNSSGGDWGYVTMVMQEDDLDYQKWQDIFNRMRELHLIPIIRLATQPQEGGYWRRPDEEDINKWIQFLDSLHWVIKDRYIVLFNEPNHGIEWGGEVDSQGYAQTVEIFSRELKAKNEDFFVMMAGLDAAAPSQLPKYEDEYQFLRQMHLGVEGGLPALFKNLDGWASHSYPNYGFVGSPHASGRNSIMNYQWELEVLREFGVNKSLPVFIKETGWPHSEGLFKQINFFSPEDVAENFRIYFQRVLPDQRVKAITPFIFNYQREEFSHFSWRKPNSDQFYPQYQVVYEIEKIAGNPEQKEKLGIKSSLPSKLIHNSTYRLFIDVFNLGQPIWDIDDGYQLKLIGDGVENFEYFFSDFKNLPPFSSQKIVLSIKTGEEVKNYDLGIKVFKNGEPVSNSIDWPVEVRPNIDLEFNVRPFLWRQSSGNDFKFLIYDSNDQIVYGRERVVVKNGKKRLTGINNIALGQEYRLVVVKPGSLPRQTFVVFSEPGLNKAVFKFLIPIDFNQDGKFNFKDIVFFISKLN